MEFEIKEYTGEIDLTKDIQDFLAGIIKFLVLIILVPILLLKKLFGQPEVTTKPKLQHYKEINGYKLQRLFIDDEEIPKDLDFPEEANDVHFFKMYSDPTIASFTDKYFDYQEAETDQGLYLISVNKEKAGMTLWCLNKQTLDLIKVKDLPSLWWNLFEEAKNVIRLRGTNGKKHFDILVNEKTAPESNA